MRLCSHRGAAGDTHRSPRGKLRCFSLLHARGVARWTTCHAQARQVAVRFHTVAGLQATIMGWGVRVRVAREWHEGSGRTLVRGERGGVRCGVGLGGVKGCQHASHTARETRADSRAPNRAHTGEHTDGHTRVGRGAEVRREAHGEGGVSRAPPDRGHSAPATSDLANGGVLPHHSSATWHVVDLPHTGAAGRRGMMRAGRETESYGCKVCEVRWWGVGMPHPHVHAPSKHETCTASVTKHTAHSTHARRARAEEPNVRKRKVLGTLATSRTSVSARASVVGGSLWREASGARQHRACACAGTHETPAATRSSTPPGRAQARMRRRHNRREGAEEVHTRSCARTVAPGWSRR